MFLIDAFFNTLTTNTIIELGTKIVIVLWDRHTNFLTILIFTGMSIFFYRVMNRSVNGFKPTSLIWMTWHINHLHLCVIKSGHNRSIVLHGSSLTRFESIGSIAHIVTYLILKPQFRALHHVAGTAYRTTLALKPFLATPQDVTQLVVAKLKPLRQLQISKELVKHLANRLLEFLPQRALALAELLERLLCQPCEQLVHSRAAVLLVALRTLAFLRHGCRERTTSRSVNLLLQVTAQMSVYRVKELRIALLANHLAQTLVVYRLMRHRGLHVVHIAVVSQHYDHLARLRVIPSLRPASACLHFCIRVRDAFHVLYDIDRSVPLLAKLLYGFPLFFMLLLPWQAETNVLCRLPRVKLMQEVAHRHIRKVLRTHLLQTCVLSRKQVASHRPVLLQHVAQRAEYIHDASLVDRTFSLRHLALLKLLQLLCATATAEVAEHLVHQLVLVLDFRVQLLHIVHHGLLFAQLTFQMLPRFGVSLLQRLAPQVVILVQRRLASRNAWVDVYLPTQREAVRLTVRRAEEPHLVRYLQVTLVKDNIVPRTVFTSAAPVFRRIADTREACLMKHLARTLGTEHYFQFFIHVGTTLSGSEDYLTAVFGQHHPPVARIMAMIFPVQIVSQIPFHHVQHFALVSHPAGVVYIIAPIVVRYLYRVEQSSAIPAPALEIFWVETVHEVKTCLLSFKFSFSKTNEVLLACFLFPFKINKFLLVFFKPSSRYFDFILNSFPFNPYHSHRVTIAIIQTFSNIPQHISLEVTLNT